jgi:hypothetical protein
MPSINLYGDLTWMFYTAAALLAALLIAKIGGVRHADPVVRYLDYATGTLAALPPLAYAAYIESAISWQLASALVVTPWTAGIVVRILAAVRNSPVRFDDQRDWRGAVQMLMCASVWATTLGMFVSVYYSGVLGQMLNRGLLWDGQAYYRAAGALLGAGMVLSGIGWLIIAVVYLYRSSANGKAEPARS